MRPVIGHFIGSVISENETHRHQANMNANDICEAMEENPLPKLAGHYLQPEKVDDYCNALSDVLCWLDGFKAGGGVYSPQTQESLRNLNNGLKSIQMEQAKSDLAHTNTKQN